MSKCMIKRIEKYILGGTIATNVADSIFYILTVWFFNERFASPILLSLVFASLSIVDTCSFLFGPIIDRTKPKVNLFGVSLVQIVCVMVLLLFLLVCPENEGALGIALLIILVITYVGSSIIYPSGEKIIPVVVEEERLLQVNSTFRTCEKVLDIMFNAIATVIITFIRIDYTVIIILGFLLIAARIYFCIAKAVDKQLDEQENLEEYSIGEYFSDLKEGILEIKKQTGIMRLFVPICLVNLFYGIAIMGLPIVSKMYVSEQAYGYGSLLAFSSAGGVLGAFLVGKLKNAMDAPSRYTSFFLTLAGVAWLGMTISLPYFYYGAYICVLVSNGAINMMNIIFVSLLQKKIEVNVLGRVSTFTESLASVMIPIGNLCGGLIIQIAHPLMAELLYGVALILCAVPYLLISREKKAN